MSIPRPSIFISYSWDSEEHRRWVRGLAERLVSNGVDVRLDQWHISPGDSLTAFMEEQIASCQHTLVICTPSYAVRSGRRRGGVGYEQQIISGQIATGVDRRRFIPILREGTFEEGPNCALPAHFAGIYAIDLREEFAGEASFELLLRAIYDVPLLVPPSLGAMPSFVGAGQRERNRPLRLADIEVDGWQLRSGEALNERSPDTFVIPSAEERYSVQEGDFVKLIFDCGPSPDDEMAPAGERMWVKVGHRSGPYITGALANNPAWIEGHPPLVFGSVVAFLPEHIISLMSCEEMEKAQINTDHSLVPVHSDCAAPSPPDKARNTPKRARGPSKR